MDWSIGSTAGNIARVNFQNIAYNNVDDQERDGIDVAALTFGCHKSGVNSAGDDEVYIFLR